MTFLGVAQALNAQMFVAVDNPAEIFLNSELLAKTLDWHNYVNYNFNVKFGDVIRIRAKDLGAAYGVVAALLYDNFYCVTKPNGGPWWVVVDERRREYANPGEAAVKRGDPGSSLLFLYDATGEQYVLAKGDGENDSFIIEIRIRPYLKQNGKYSCSPTLPALPN